MKLRVEYLLDTEEVFISDACFQCFDDVYDYLEDTLEKDVIYAKTHFGLKIAFMRKEIDKVIMFHEYDYETQRVLVDVNEAD